MNARLHVVCNTDDPLQVEEVRAAIKAIYSEFSFSPERDYRFISGYTEMYGIAKIQKEDIQKVLDALDNDWMGDYDSCECYDFNSKIFDPRIYYMSFDLF